MKKYLQATIIIFFILITLFSMPVYASDSKFIKNFSLNLWFKENSYNNTYSSFYKSFNKLLPRISITSEGFIDDTSKVDLSIALLDNASPLLSIDVYGNPWDYSITSDLFNKSALSLDFRNYTPFMLKMTDYFYFPFHYVAYFTDIYAYEYALTPSVNFFKDIFLSNNDYILSPEEKTITFSTKLNHLLEDKTFQTYVHQLFRQTDLSYILEDFFFEYPNWFESFFENGIDLHILDKNETWYLKNKLFMEKNLTPSGEKIFIFFPPYEDLEFQIAYEKTLLAHEYLHDITLHLIKQNQTVFSLTFLSSIESQAIDDFSFIQNSFFKIDIDSSNLDEPLVISANIPHIKTEKETSTNLQGSLLLTYGNLDYNSLNLEFDLDFYEVDSFEAYEAPDNLTYHKLFTVNDDLLPYIERDIIYPVIRHLLPKIFSLPSDIVSYLISWVTEHGIARFLID